jgi:predicted Zn-dependent protease
LGRIHYFNALIQKADGDYDGAIKSLRIVTSKYPRDRVVQNQLGRILFLKREYKQALKALDAVQEVDSEDVQMHYTKMLCYRGLNDNENAAREEKLFKRFKVEESVQSITNVRRQASPEDNNERQQIHDHETVDLRVLSKPAAPRKPAGETNLISSGGSR